MSLSYQPSSNATAEEPWDTAFLSDRDVSSQVPINFVPHPGIFVTQACFPNNVYDNNDAQTCISNLLASEIRRFIFDLYWDPTNRVFSLCPVQIPSAFVNTTSESLVASETSGSASSIAPVSQSTGQTLVHGLHLGTINSTSSALNVSHSATPTATAPSASTTTNAAGNTLVQLGPYQCSPNLDAGSISALFNSYQYASSNTVDARLQILLFNLHAAAPLDNPSSSIALSGADLPRLDEVLSKRFTAISQLFYTPAELDEDRSNLNATWYRRPNAYQLPLTAYFTIETLPNGAIRTSNGWPNENYVQINLGRRFLTGIGTIDDELTGYPVQEDISVMFPPGALSNDRAASLAGNGSVVEGCFYNSGEFLVNQLNNSWATSAILNIDVAELASAADNLTMCGISPVLNFTINNAAAGVQPDPYQDFGNQALFSWASGEPINSTASNTSASDSQFRCALMVSTDAYRGHWRVEDCRAKYRAACRQLNRPYLWRLSDNNVTFDSAPEACPDGTTFDVPRTGLENNYLYHHMTIDSAVLEDTAFLNGIWINFNSIDVGSCWVTTGPNGTCPYYQDENAIRHRQILVPAIAALVVVLITMLTVLVKCSDNRRNSKVRKRGEGGWDYEGVPS